MICEKCQDEGHFWFAYDDEPIDKETEDLIGIYAWCDMRRVYQLGIGCECSCHEKEKNENEKRLRK